MRLISIIFVLLITELTDRILCESSSEEDDIQGAQPCPGGYCVPSYQCMNGTINKDGDHIISARFNDEDAVEINLTQEEDPCEQFLMRCCASDSAPKPPNPETDSSTIISPPTSCGVNHPNGYILKVNNASVAQFAEFPWMASLLQRKDRSSNAFEYFCGGSLIHPKVVLTAAHCMKGRNEQNSMVRLGEWDTVTENEPPLHQQYGVSRIIIHEHFIDSKFHHDVALLILKEEAELNVHINPICLPDSEANFDNQRCMVSGWGKENFNPEGKYSEVLKKVELPVVPRSQCKRIFKTTKLGPFFQLHKSFMCAGGEPGVDVCKGDGGSPLACKSGDQFVQAGIVAWGLGCGDNGIPGAYVKVSNYVDWIRTTLQGEGIDL